MDHEDGGEGHCSGSDQGAQQTGGGDRDGRDVVGEGPDQVGADGAVGGAGEGVMASAIE